MVNNKQIKWNTWIDKGINMIHDMINCKGEFLTPCELEQKYNIKCDIMQFNN